MDSVNKHPEIHVHDLTGEEQTQAVKLEVEDLTEEPAIFTVQQTRQGNPPIVVPTIEDNKNAVVKEKEPDEEIETITAKERTDSIKEVAFSERPNGIEDITFSSPSSSTTTSSSPSSTSPAAAAASSAGTRSTTSPVGASIQKVPAAPAATITKAHKLDKRNVIQFIKDERPGAIENKKVKFVEMKPLEGQLEFEPFKRGGKEDYLRTKVTWVITVETATGGTEELELHQYLETWIEMPQLSSYKTMEEYHEAIHNAKIKSWMLMNSYAMQYKDALGGVPGTNGRFSNPNIHKVEVLAKTHILTFNLYHPNIEATRNLKVMHQFQNQHPHEKMYSGYNLASVLDPAIKPHVPDWVETELDLICYTAAKSFIVDDSGKKINQSEIDAYFKGADLKPKDIPNDINTPDEAKEVFQNMETRIAQNLQHIDTLTSSFTDPFPKKVEPQKSWLRENVVDKVTKHFRKDKIHLYGDMVAKVNNLKANKIQYNKAQEPGWIRKKSETDIQLNKQLVEATNAEITEISIAGKELLERIDGQLKRIDDELEQYRALQYALILKYEPLIAAGEPIHNTLAELKTKLINNDFKYGVHQQLLDKALSEILDKATLDAKETELLKAGKELEEKIQIKKARVNEIKSKWKPALNDAINELPKASTAVLAA